MVAIVRCVRIARGADIRRYVGRHSDQEFQSFRGWDGKAPDLPATAEDEAPSPGGSAEERWWQSHEVGDQAEARSDVSNPIGARLWWCTGPIDIEELTRKPSSDERSEF